MIRGWIAGFDRPSRETRHGDSTVFIDDKNKICFIIDGGCDECATALIKYLKRNGIKKVYASIPCQTDSTKVLIITVRYNGKIEVYSTKPVSSWYRTNICIPCRS